MDYPISTQERRNLLTECGQMIRLAQDTEQGKTARAAGIPKEAADDILRKIAILKTQYRDHLPVLPLSRCPFTGQVLYRSIDLYGIDGYWWDYHNPIRLLTFMPSTFLSFTGALGLSGPVEETAFLCSPGPGVPFVIPKLLSGEKVKAVIFSLKIGPHTGYPIVYFANPGPQGIEPLNDWGTDHWKYCDLYGGLHWNESVDIEDEHDFNLDPYLRSGQLLWISPGDRTMTFRSGLVGCPYVDLKGERRIQRIQYGKVWTT
jgi:hypothetical protein